jgi:hypothetical protein
MGQTKPIEAADTSVYKSLAEDADRPVKNLLQRRDAASKQMEQEQLGLKTKMAKDLADPNSSISKTARELYSKAIGKSLDNSVSAQQIQNAGFDSVVNASLRAKELAEARATREALHQRDKSDRVIAKAQESLNKLDKEEQEANANIDAAIAMAGEATKSPTAAANLARAVVKAVEGAGARVSDKDAQTALKAGGVSKRAIASLSDVTKGTIPSFQAEDVSRMVNVLKEFNKIKFNNRRGLITDRAQKATKLDKDSVRDLLVMPEAPKLSTDGQRVRVQMPDGQIGTIPQEKVEAAVKRGAKVL